MRGSAVEAPRDAWEHLRRPARGSLFLALIVVALAVCVGAAPAGAAERTVKLTLSPSAAACTALNQLDCSYLEARNGNAASPDDPAIQDPTFLNLADLPAPVTIGASIAGDGTVTIPAGQVEFPAYPTSLENDLVGTVEVQIKIFQTGTWTGAFDQATGAMSLTAPLGLTFTLTCDPVPNPLCGGIFGASGNMGTWEATAKGPVDPLTTGHLDAPSPPAAYGPDWLGPDAEDGSPYDAETGSLTLINNDLELERLGTEDCIDPSSPACSNAAVGGLILPALNSAIGATDVADTVPGAIDLRLTFDLTEPSLVSADPGAVDFGEQRVGVSGPAKAITLSAFDLGDVNLNGIYAEGEDDADFLVANDNCGGQVPAGGTCTVKLRFNPAASGARGSELFAAITNPLSGARERVKLADLTGTGTEPPAPSRGLRPELDPKVVSRVRHRRALVARVRCPEGECAITRSRAKIRANGRGYDGRLKGPATIAEGTRERLEVTVPRRAMRVLRRVGKGKARVRLVVKSTNGTRTRGNLVVVVRPKAKRH